MAKLTRREWLCLGLSTFVAPALYAEVPQPPKTTERSALVVVDAQVGVLATVWESKRVIQAVEQLVAAARTADVPIIWVQHENDSDLKTGSAAWQLAPEFVPNASELVIRKRFNSAFAETKLESHLRALGVTRLVLAGAATNWCIRATAYAAVDRGFNLTLVGNAHSTESMTLESGQVISAESMIADLNAVFEWLLAPGVDTNVLDSGNVVF
ncbi:cysteine hydrolase [Ahniella affigens]|uniref:Cysteine hydrolase n=1 Tax=Ahniella affigens TaxID=2021234 RepID=A0A2P1PPV6_9GAMM|nr:isochorismatase family protein [Ahniella affigens]AVP96858.1 cysteine hydrolase [Ahniella affigens]